MVTVVEYLAHAIKDKPTDGSDVRSLREARAELVRLRRVAFRVCHILHATTNGAADRPPAVRPAVEREESARKKKRAALAEEKSYQSYEKATVPKSDEVRGLLKAAMLKNPLFKDSCKHTLDDFADVFSERKFSAGETVIQQGDEGHTFYVVESGALDIYVNVGQGDYKTETQVGVPYGPGAGFGELALMYNSQRAATIRASDDCVLWEISRAAFKGLRFHHNQAEHAAKLKTLAGVKIGDQSMGDVLSQSDLDSMALAVKTENFAAGDVIVREGEKGDVFYVIWEGSVEVRKGGEKLTSLGENNFFGERALLSSQTRQATIVAETDVVCMTLLRDDFVLLLGNMEDVLSGKTTASLYVATRELFAAKMEQAEATSYVMDDLEKKGVLGEGAFGKVNLVKSKEGGRLFALKAQSKAFLVENVMEQHTIREYQLVRELNHVFIVKIYQALQDKKYVYFLMNLLPGGELMDLLESKRKFPENWARFYSAAVVSAFQHIHRKQIAYRDLKPENLVLDADGYCYVIDFGLAKRCDAGKTWTLCGTPDYLAPEVVTGKGHDWGVDYWGLGIFLYEIRHGNPPFYADDPTMTMKKINKGTYRTPGTFSQPLSDLIAKLLCQQSKRLGRTKGGADKIIKHPFFSGFNWDGFLGKTMEVPWKPKVGELEKLGKFDHSRANAPDSPWNPVF